MVALAGDLMWTHRAMAVLLGAVIGAVMVAVFLGIAWVLKVDEVRWLVGMATRTLRRSERTS